MDSLKDILLKRKQEAEAQQNQEAEKPKMTKEDVVARFVSYIEAFYHSIENDWLKDLHDDGLCDFKREEMFINEERLGSYSVNELKVQMGNITVEFKPVGTVMIGTIGRIDMYVNGGYVSNALFIIVPENATGPRIRVVTWEEGVPKPKPEPEVEVGQFVWKYVERGGRMNYVSLDKTSFQSIILKNIQ